MTSSRTLLRARAVRIQAVGPEQTDTPGIYLQQNPGTGGASRHCQARTVPGCGQVRQGPGPAALGMLRDPTLARSRGLARVWAPLHIRLGARTSRHQNGDPPPPPPLPEAERQTCRAPRHNSGRRGFPTPVRLGQLAIPTPTRTSRESTACWRSRADFLGRSSVLLDFDSLLDDHSSQASRDGPVSNTHRTASANRPTAGRTNGRSEQTRPATTTEHRLGLSLHSGPVVQGLHFTPERRRRIPVVPCSHWRANQEGWSAHCRRGHDWMMATPRFSEGPSRDHGDCLGPRGRASLPGWTGLLTTFSDFSSPRYRHDHPPSPVPFVQSHCPPLDSEPTSHPRRREGLFLSLTGC